ncbi:MAG: cation-transporting P-type ATPase [archaeon]|jgi:Ca2+-transporting ATPase|nr:cation-transporting P-type ATPase [archaeon]MDD2477620.1 cation-transporting P-type ATPase [Candidatus ainarchaeum sp.]MDD3084285.1 cation-transporting P-type ATPase [Candidatus ainarchaeum sp.]MDD4221026.1 cation-transporting P-type ATPase [Candidatus ainarchaeum sp.]MDD4662498.1 cation-transporting P-type ATPase [Candidatus ainarchaeum sp.]
MFLINTKFSELLKQKKSSVTLGLESKDAKQRLIKFGANELIKNKKGNLLKIIIRQFKNALILLLVFAGFLSLFLGNTIESIAIFVIIILNIILGFIQEYRAEKAIDALKKISEPFTRVIRDGVTLKIPSKEVVVGDIVVIEAGDIVSCDGVLFETSSLEIEEASLTGESLASKKSVTSKDINSQTITKDAFVYMGTTVTYGKGKYLVTSTGMNTEFGKIAKSLHETKETLTPLQIKFKKLARQIGIVAVILIIIVLLLGLLQNTLSFEKMILFALALTVSTIPNSLPIIVTVGLSIGSKKLAKQNLLIKTLPAAESLGSVTIIVSDKTGTITKNQMTATQLYINHKIIDVTGTGYVPKGEFYFNNRLVNKKELELLLKIGYLCNNSKLTKKENRHEIIGDPTEGALIVLGEKQNIKEDLKNYSLIEELPFDSDRKIMSSIYSNNLVNKKEAYVKGAYDLLIKRCTKILDDGKIRAITKKDITKLNEINILFANKALRVLGLAYKDVSNLKKYNFKNIEEDLVFVGLVGMIDPPRDEIKQAIADCKSAGIETMIVTGDHATTTIAVAKQIGIYKKDDVVLTGKDVEEMSDLQLENIIDKIRIVARVLPIQKLRIVSALQKKGHVVAMTGDGVNDSPALKKADIGVSMGITGTDVSKEVSKAILVDDNFATIVNGIKEGRNIYDKMIKSAKYLLSCNAGEIFTVFFAILLGFPLPLLPLQILLMSILTDDFPALGLGFEKGEPKIMKRPPRVPNENPISRKLFLSIIIFGFIMGLGTLLLFNSYLPFGLSKAQTVAFTTLVMFQVFAVVSSRRLYSGFRHLNPFTNKYLSGAIFLSIAIQLIVIYFPPLQIVFGTVSLALIDWVKIIVVSSLGFIIMEVSKLFFQKEKISSFVLKKI